MTRTIAFLLLLFNYYHSFANYKAIIKANIVRGENFVTAETNPTAIEKIISHAFIRKGFQIVTEVIPNEQIFFVDLFVFQFPGAYPTTTLVIRTKNGIHYIDKERIKLFSDREAANMKLALKLAEKLPEQIDTSIYFEPTVTDIFRNKQINPIGTSSKSSTKGNKSKSDSLILINKVIPDFIIPDEFDVYLAYASNFQGIRKQLKGQEINLKLKINTRARFELVEIGASFELSEKQKNQLQEFIDSFPLWSVENQIDDIEFKFVNHKP